MARIISVPDYSSYVEGDNKANSVDSRNSVHGAVSKNLLVGVAEYVLWPPQSMATDTARTCHGCQGKATGVLVIV
jgi:hypothetical protein